MTRTTIHSDYIPDNAITGTKIAENSITAREIATNAITTLYVADNSVTEDKLADSINTSIAAKLPLAGGTMTGTLAMDAAIDIKSGSAIHGTITTSSNSLTLNARNTGILLFQSGGNEKARIDSNGRLFLGATSASALNTFSDDLIISNTASGTGAGISIVSNATNGYSNIHFGDTDDADIGRIQYNNTSNVMTFRTNTSDAITIDSSQNVGIGTSTPGSNHAKANNLVVGSGSAGGMAVYNGTSEGWYAFSRDNANNTDAYDGGMSYTDRVLTFHVNSGTERMRIDGSGHVGIGMTPAPVGSDTVLALYNSATPRIKLHNSTTGTASGDGGEINMSGSDFILENREAGNVRFFNNGSERIRIRSDGDVLVGGITDRGRKFVVEGTGDLMALYSTNAGAGGAQLDLIHDSASPADGDNVGIINFSDDAKQYASIKGIAENTGASGAMHLGVRTDGSNYNATALIISSAGQVTQPSQYYTTTYRGANQSVGAIAWTNWTFNSDLDNTGTNMRSADGVITFPIAGLYLVTGLLSVESPAATNYNQFRAAFGGTANNAPIFLGINELVSNNAYGYDIPISFMVKITNTGTDLMYIQAFSGSGSLTLRGGTSSSHLNVRLLG